MAVVVGYERQWDAQVRADRSVVQRLKLKQQRPVFWIKIKCTKGVTKDRLPGIWGRYREGYEFDR